MRGTKLFSCVVTHIHLLKWEQKVKREHLSSNSLLEMVASILAM